MGWLLQTKDFHSKHRLEATLTEIPMSYIDVAIPLFSGLLMAACPQLFTKQTATVTDQEFASRKDKFRKIGFVLIGVAALYLVTKLGGSR